MNRQSLFLSALLLLMCLEVCNGIWCFVCHTNTDPGCGDEFSISTSDTDTRQECSGMCIKRRGKRKRGSVSRVEIQRSCKAFGSEGCYTEDFNGLEQYTCLCGSDFCNGAPNHFGQCFMLLITVPLAITTAVKFLFL